MQKKQRTVGELGCFRWAKRQRFVCCGWVCVMLAAVHCYGSNVDCSNGFVAGCYGLTAIETIQTNLPTTTFGGGGQYTNQQLVGAQVILQEPSYNLAPISHSDTVTAFDPIANGIYTGTAAASVSDASIYEGKLMSTSIATQGGTADQYLVDNGTAQTYLTWVDTLTVGGLPSGTPVTLQITDSFSGGLSLSGQADGSQVTQQTVLGPPISEGGCSEASLVNSVSTAGPVSSVQQFSLCTVSGATLILSELLQSQVTGGLQWSASAGFSAVNHIDPQSDFAAASNVVSLTPGATLTSASGVDYSTPVVVTPELPPAVLLGMSTIFLGCIVFGRKVRRFQAAHANAGRLH